MSSVAVTNMYLPGGVPMRHVGCRSASRGLARVRPQSSGARGRPAPTATHLFMTAQNFVAGLHGGVVRRQRPRLWVGLERGPACLRLPLAPGLSATLATLPLPLSLTHFTHPSAMNAWNLLPGAVHCVGGGARERRWLSGQGPGAASVQPTRGVGTANTRPAARPAAYLCCDFLAEILDPLVDAVKLRGVRSR